MAGKTAEDITDFSCVFIKAYTAESDYTRRPGGTEAEKGCL